VFGTVPGTQQRSRGLRRVFVLSNFNQKLHGRPHHSKRHDGPQFNFHPPPIIRMSRDCRQWAPLQQRVQHIIQVAPVWHNMTSAIVASANILQRLPTLFGTCEVLRSPLQAITSRPAAAAVLCASKQCP
jgi:hypothetical protein